MKNAQSITAGLLIGLLTVLCWMAFQDYRPQISIDEKATSVGNLQQVANVQITPDIINLPKVNPPAVSTTDQQGLTISLQAERSVYVLGEPVFVTVAVHNLTSNPITIYDSFYIEAGNIQVQVSDDSGEFRTYRGPFPVASKVAVSSTLAPGAQRSLSFNILYNNPTSQDALPYFYAFAQVGRYQLRAELNGILPQKTLISAPVEIEVLAPHGIDAQIWRLLQTEDAASYLQTGSTRNAKVIGRFQTILAQYPDNFYAPLMYAALGPVYTETVKSKTESQTASSQSMPVLRTVDEDLYFVYHTSNNNVRAANSVDEETLNQIIDMIHMWVDAWNSQDFDSYAQLHSKQTKTWQDWQTGPESFTYFKLNDGMKSLFASTGTVTVEIIDFTIRTDDILVDVTPHFTGQRFVFNGMRFVKDEDGIWRLASLE